MSNGLTQKSFKAIALLGLLSSAAVATPVFTDDVDPYLSGIYTSADMEVFSVARNLNDGNGDWELGTGSSNTDASQLSTAHFNWINGTTYAFSFSQDALGMTTLSLGGQSVSRNLVPVNDLFLEAKSSSSGGDVSIDNIVFNGSAYVGSLLAENDGTHLDIVRINGFSGPFVLSGELTFSWEGAAPNRDRTAMYIKGFSEDVPPIPEPGTIGLMGLGLLGMALLARRRRA